MAPGARAPFSGDPASARPDERDVGLQDVPACFGRADGVWKVARSGPASKGSVADCEEVRVEGSALAKRWGNGVPSA